MPQETLRKGIVAARRGHHESARRLLISVVSEEPSNELAWSWLARVTDDPSAKRDYLNTVRKLNPNNSWAAGQLSALDGGTSPNTSPSSSVTPPPPPARTELVELKCPNCGGNVSVHGGKGVKSAVCTYCGSVLDLSAEQAAILGQVDPQVEPFKPIYPGDKGRFDGKEYEVYGWMRYEGADSEETWHWDEWLLIANDGHSLWLSYDPEDGWALQERIADFEPFNPRTASFIRTSVGSARITERDSARLVALRGEFTWQARIDDHIQYLDAQTRDYLFSVEYTADELEVHGGARFTDKEIKKAFASDQGIPALQLKKHEARQKAAKREAAAKRAGPRKTILLVLTLLALLLLAFSFMTGRKTYEDTATVGMSNPVQSLTPVTLSNTDQAHRITLSIDALPTNSWFMVSAWAYDEKDTKYHLYSATFWDEAGRDSDGPWHEDELKISHLFRPATAGAYRLELNYEEASPNAPQQKTVTVEIEEGLWLSRYFIFLALFCGVLWYFYHKRST